MSRPKREYQKDFENIVYKLIPVDGTPIRHKDLMNKCVPEEMYYQTMQNALKHLEETGYIIKETVKSTKGAGTQYRRFTKFSWKGVPFPHDVKSFSEMLKQLNSRALSEQSEYYQAKYGTLNIYHAFDAIFTGIIFPALIEYADNPDKEQAEKRLNIVLKDAIVPLLIQTAKEGIVPALPKFKEQAQIALESMLDTGFIESDRQDLWNSALGEVQEREHKYCIYPRMKHLNP